MRIWEFEVSECDETSVSGSSFDAGSVVADNFDEAVKKIRGYLKEAWCSGEPKLMITKVEFDRTIKIE